MCKYCEELDELINNDTGNVLYVNIDYHTEKYDWHIDCADFDIAINYCPMCGKELRKEKIK